MCTSMRLFVVLLVAGTGVFCFLECKKSKTYLFLLPFCFAFLFGMILAYDAVRPRVLDALCVNGVQTLQGASDSGQTEKESTTGDVAGTAYQSGEQERSNYDFALQGMCMDPVGIRDIELQGMRMDPVGIRDIELQGTVCEIARSKTGAKVYIKNILYHFDAYGTVYEGHLKHKVLMAVEDTQLQLGQSVMCEGTLNVFTHERNPGGFDAWSYYRSRNVDYQLEESSIMVLQKDTWPVREGLRQLRIRLVEQIQALMGTEDAGFLEAVLLGEKADFDEDMKAQYQMAGIAHIIAISGLHLGLLGMGIYRFLRKYTLPVLPSAFVAGTLIVLYGLLTGMSGSCQRAIVMMLISFGGRILIRAYDMLSAMSLAALLILIFAPLQLFDAGFLLSFGAVFGVAILQELRKYWKQRSKVLDDSWGKESVKGEGIKKKQEKEIGEGIKKRQEKEIGEGTKKRQEKEIGRKTKYILRNFRDSLLTTLAIQIVTLPVLIWFYYEIPMYSIFLNLIVIPLMSLLIPVALIGIVISLFWFDLGVMVMKPVTWMIHFYNALAVGSNRLPFSHLVTGKPEIWQVILYVFVVAMLIALVCCWGIKRVRLLMIAGLFLSCIGGALLLGERNLKIDMLDVGQGDGLVVRTPAKQVILIDGGSSSEKKLYQYTYRPYLLSQGITYIDMVIVSHGDSDHISGILELMEQGYPIGKLVLPDISDPDEHYLNLRNKAQSYGIPVTYLSRGQSIVEEELVLTCIHPISGYHCEDPNEYSTTVSLTFRDFSMLFTGDLGGDAEQEVADYLNAKNLCGIESYTVLKVGHHGSKSSTSAELLNQVRPRYALISAGRNNRYGHPHKETLQSLDLYGAKIKSTQKEGAIRMETDGQTLFWK